VRRDDVRGSGVDARERRTALPEDTLAALKHRAEAALATDGVEHTRLGYEVLVKLKRDELLLEARGMGGHSGRHSAPDTITIRVAGEEMHDEGL
jgi:hypothetical protein